MSASGDPTIRVGIDSSAMDLYAQRFQYSLQLVGYGIQMMGQSLDIVYGTAITLTGQLVRLVNTWGTMRTLMAASSPVPAHLIFSLGAQIVSAAALTTVMLQLQAGRTSAQTMQMRALAQMSQAASYLR